MRKASTSGWGLRSGWKPPEKSFATDLVKQCFECHQPEKDQDDVYSI